MPKFQRIAFVATIGLFAFAISAASVEARGPAHIGSFHAGGIGGGAGIRSGPVGGSFSRGAPMIRSAPTARTFHSAPKFVTRGYSGRHYSRSHGLAHKSYGQYGHRAVRSGKTVHGSKSMLAKSDMGKVHVQRGSSKIAKGNINRQIEHRNRNVVTKSMLGVKSASMLRNDAWAKHVSRKGMAQDLSKTSFHGKFADKHWDKHGDKHWDNWHGKWHWRHHHPIIVIGWYGSLFWPWAYWDFVDYTFWPYAYDVFWPYAYDDLYEGVFGPYAYEGPAYADARPASRGAQKARKRVGTTTAVVCNAQAPALTDWPIRQIAQTVKPDEAQQSALNDLKDATSKAVEVLQAACPDELPSTPTGRLDAMRKRIGTMLLAVSIVQPPLQRFYDSLNDEQKARFNVIGPEAQIARASSDSNGSRDLSRLCGEELLKASVPTERMVQVLKPTDAQRTALDALAEATKKSGDFLKANCSLDQPLTPPARVAAMEQRLNAMLEATKMVQPALENFYGSLTNEQKARFNQLGLPQG